MSELKLEFVGKNVKDMYGTSMGKVVGIITDTDGSIESVGVDCGSAGLKQLAYEQLLVQGDYVVYIPRWRLDAQRLLRQKNLTLQRIKGLQDIVAENDLMKDDAELVYLKYEKKLRDLGENEKHVNEKLQARLNELDTESKYIKSVLFDAKLQFRSNEITEEAFQQITSYSNELIEHISVEKSEINNVRTRLAQQTLENIALTPMSQNDSTPTPDTKADTGESPQRYLGSTQSVPAPSLVNTDPTIANEDSTEDKKIARTITSKDESESETRVKAESETRVKARTVSESEWLNQVIQYE
jgi:hypothetical protein